MTVAVADVRATGGGFTGTTVEFTALTEAGQKWLTRNGGIGVEAIMCTKTQAAAGIADAKANGLTVEWA